LCVGGGIQQQEGAEEGTDISSLFQPGQITKQYANAMVKLLKPKRCFRAAISQGLVLIQQPGSCPIFVAHRRTAEGRWF
jgi:hypothetical protein